MFIKNKHLAIYENFIEDRKLRKNFKNDFFETHHIIPKSLGGSDDPSNLIQLTPREHFFAHLLLAKITIGDANIKMAHALNMMAGLSKNSKIINSRQYELAKSVYYKILQSAGKDYQEEKELQNLIFTEYTSLDKVLERGVCKTCGIRPRAVNYVKGNKTFYRSKCDVCLAGKNKFKIPMWKRDGYSKKHNCEMCGFSAKFTEQLTVIVESKKYKTVCLNCQAALRLSDRTNILKAAADY